MMRIIKIKVTIVFSIALSVLAACGIMPEEDVYPLILEDHALAEKIWDVKAGQFVSKERLLEAVRQKDYILLGETHDNLLHHKYQAWLIDNLYRSGFSALVAFEMITQGQGEIIENKQYNSSSDLINDLNQVKTTWNYKQRYTPVFESVLSANFPIYPANLDRATIMSIARKGEENVPVYIKPYLEKNTFSSEQEKELKEEIKMSHCGMENPHMTNAMMLTQRVKDAEMANSLMRDIEIQKRVLVAGSGHTRNDRGVPMYIRSESKDAKILSIAWLEVVNEYGDMDQYAQRWGGEKIPFDYIWFTPRVDRPDPCKSFRQHMKNKDQKSTDN